MDRRALEREPFLLSIFAEPGDDLRRLVFADWLEERGEEPPNAQRAGLDFAQLNWLWAKIIRLQCSGQDEEAFQEIPRAYCTRSPESCCVGDNASQIPQCEFKNCKKGLPAIFDITLSVADLTDTDMVRLNACSRHPWWYGAQRLKLKDGPLVDNAPLETVFHCPVWANVTELDLSGNDSEQSTALVPISELSGSQTAISTIPLAGDHYSVRPMVHPQVIDMLAGMRECRRLTSLNLENNGLGNDALLSLARSPYFTRLKELRLSRGNYFRGRVWQQVLQRFGEEVVV